MTEYAEPDSGEFHGAYGHRWRSHFAVDQIRAVCELLRKDPLSRRAVLGMWDARVDLSAEKNDLPCNTHIYLRIVNGGLDFTVCNRSNDVVWGMTGANAVHMTLLHELIAAELGVWVGNYRVFTNNAHLYERHWLMDRERHPVRFEDYVPLQVLAEGETLEQFLLDCEAFCANPSGQKHMTTHWMKEVAGPVEYAWANRTGLERIGCPQIMLACILYLHHKRG